MYTIATLRKYHLRAYILIFFYSKLYRSSATRNATTMAILVGQTFALAVGLHGGLFPIDREAKVPSVRLPVRHVIFATEIRTPAEQSLRYKAVRFEAGQSQLRYGLQPWCGA